MGTRDVSSEAAVARRHLDAGVSVKEVYEAADAPEEPPLPGEFPFTRGIEARPSAPLIKMYSGLGTPDQANQRYRRLRELGVEVLQMATDLPSQVGYDPDHLMAAGEVGRAGVAISSLRDMEIAFAGVPLRDFERVGMLGNSTGPISLALFVALGEKQGLALGDYVVDLQNDPLKEYVARGTQILPIGPAVRLAADVVEWCAENARHWYPLDACVNHLNMAGAGSTKATAVALANLLTYVDELLGRGLSFDQVAPLLQMFLDEREDFFVAVANARATRRLWAEIAANRYGASEKRAMCMQLMAYGHGRETRQEPVNNVVRITLGCLAYRLSGLQSMYSSSYDEALSTPADEAVKLSVRTQQILREEQGLDVVADPLGGSYYLEALTEELATAIRSELEKIETMGGAVACIESGYVKGLLAEGAMERQRRFEDGTRATVGVNRYVLADEEEVRGRVPAADPRVERIQAESLREVRAKRDRSAVKRALADVEAAVASEENVVEPMLAAVREYATIGELADTLRAVCGEWSPDQSY